MDRHYIVRSAVIMLTMVMGMFGIAGCTDALDIFGGSSSSGELKTATIEIDVASSVVAERTRADGACAWDESVVKNIWIGVFIYDETNKNAGKLIASEEWIANGNGWTPKEDGATHPVAKNGLSMSVMYPDINPKVIVVGVANYKDIKAYGDATTTASTVEDLLSQVKTLKDYLAISIDAQSADEKADENGCRIMSNLAMFPASNEGKDAHNNFTMSADGDIASTSTANTNTAILQLDNYSKTKIIGNLHLRRMIARNVVNIIPGEDIELSNISYKAFNLPTRTYIQERTMNGYKKSEWQAYDTWEKWFAQSPNAADYFPENQPVYYTDLEEGVVEQTSEGYRFEFLQYDNKHWAVKKNDDENDEICNQYGDREKLLDNNSDNQPLYRSLCVSENYWFNNYASYFQIYATVIDKKTGVTAATADVTYTIHEGGANDTDLSDLTNSAWTGKRSRDFMCVRNTEYVYTVKITGLNSFTVDVDAENPAVSGFAKTVTYETGSEGSDQETSAELYLTDAQRASLVYRIYQPASPSLTRAADGADFGTFDPDQFEDMASLSSDWKADSGYEKTTDSDNNNDFYKGIKFYAYDEATNVETEIGTFDKFVVVAGSDADNSDKLKKYIVKVNAKYDAVCPYNLRNDYARFFYCYPQDAVEKETRKYQPLIIIKQYPQLPKLSLPTIDAIEKFENSIGTAAPVAIANYVNSVTVNLQKESFGVENDETTVATTYYISIDGGQQIEATKNGMALTAALPGLSAGKHTLTVSASHDLYYAPSDKSEAVEFYVYPTSMTWDASQAPKTTGSVITWYGDSKYDGIQYHGLELGDKITKENATDKYFSTPGVYSETGDNSGRYIKFTALYDGIVTVKASSTGDKEDARKIVVKDGTGKQLQSGGAENTSSYTRKFNVTKGEIMIYSSKSGLRFYEIAFEYTPFVRNWDFTNWSADTKANLAAGVDWSDTEKADGSNVTDGNCFWQVGSSDINGETLKANGKIIKELGGLRFINSSTRSLAIAVNYPSTSLGTYNGGQYLWLGSSNVNYFIIPNVTSGSTIKMGVESHKPAEARGVKLCVSDSGALGEELKGTDGNEVAVPTEYEVQTWVVPAGDDNVDIIVKNTSGCHIYFIDVN